MTSVNLLEQIKEIEADYSENSKKINDCQNQLAELANKKIYLEGAFNALKGVYDKLVKEESQNCDEEQPKKTRKNVKTDA